MTLEAGSLPRYGRSSFSFSTALLPRLMNLEKPKRSPLAQSRMA